MGRTLTNDQVRRLRLRAQRLQAPEAGGVAAVVRAVGGIQAQDAAAAALGVRVRSAGLTVGDLTRAREQERSIVRTWGLRGTLHLLATEDLGWLLPLLGPPFVAGDRRRRAALGLDEETCTRGLRLLDAALAAAGPLTRAEIVARLDAGGVRLEGQAAPHLLGRAALEGRICLGPDRGAEPTYVRLADWVGSLPATLPARDAAGAELARRYLAAYGPAGPEDLAAWSGLPRGEVRAAWTRIAGDLVAVETGGGPAWMLSAQAAEIDAALPGTPLVRLLPRFDNYLLGYRTRDLVVRATHARRIHPGGGILHAALLVDGWVVGTWRMQRRRGTLEVAVEPFDSLSPAARPGLEAEVADLGRFLGAPARLDSL